MYNAKSLKAEEFINDAEILETIEYAEKNKNNIDLIDSILLQSKQNVVTQILNKKSIPTVLTSFCNYKWQAVQ